MEESVVTSGSKVLFEYGFLGVSVVILSFFLWKVVNSVWAMVNDTIERQRIANDKKDEIILELSKRIVELENKKR